MVLFALGHEAQGQVGDDLLDHLFINRSSGTGLFGQSPIDDLEGLIGVRTLKREGFAVDILNEGIADVPLCELLENRDDRLLSELGNIDRRKTPRQSGIQSDG